MKPKHKNIYVHLIAFLFPIILLTVVFALGRVYPFGDRLVLLTDLYHQYVHFYSYFLDAFKGNDNLLYNWDAGLGSNFIGNIAYYTGSPLLFILFLFPREYLAEGVLVLILFKFGLCGMSISYFIRRKFKSLKAHEVILFSAFYALMSYTISYFYNVMWLDGIILLPLIILSIDAILDKKTVVPYAILLLLLIISNFYIAYMVCLYLFFYFFISFIQLKGFESPRLLGIIFFKFAFASLIAIGLSAFLTVPTFFQLVTSLSSTSEANDYQGLSFLYKLFSGSYDSVSDGLPNIYVGSFIFILTPIFFFLSNIHLHEKIKWGILSFILIISFVTPALDLVWHAGDSPNWFPNRYSFLFSFTLLYMSLAAYQSIHTIKIRPLLYIIITIILLLTLGITTSDLEIHFMINLALLLLFCLFLFSKQCKFKGIDVRFIILCFYTVTELLFNSSVIYISLIQDLGSPLRENFQAYNDYAIVIDELKNNDNALYYRIETDINQTNNDSLRLNHSSLGHSSSMLSNDLINTMNALGLYARKANYNEKGSTIFTQSILGLKYYISSTELNKDGYDLLSKANNLYIYKNRNYLPIGFPLPLEIKNLDIHKVSNPFKLQNSLYQNMFLTDDVLFQSIPLLKIEYINGEVKELPKGKLITRSDSKKPIIVKYYLKVKKKHRLYTHFRISTNVSPVAFINDKKADNFIKNNFDGIFDVGRFDKEKVVIELHFDEEEVKYTDNELFYVSSASNLTSYTDNHRSAFVISDLKENYMRADVRIDRDEQLLFLSIPWDEGWKFTVDDQRVEPIKIFGSFIGIPLEKGEHELQLSFLPKGFLAGSVISGCTLISCFILFIIRYYKRKRGS